MAISNAYVGVGCSFNIDIDWIKRPADDEDGEDELFWSSDDKTTFCGDKIHIYDCKDTDGKVLYEITSDTCLSGQSMCLCV